VSRATVPDVPVAIVTNNSEMERWLGLTNSMPWFNFYMYNQSLSRLANRPGIIVNINNCVEI
jgi:hypothetical protein